MYFKLLQLVCDQQRQPISVLHNHAFLLQNKLWRVISFGGDANRSRAIVSILQGLRRTFDMVAANLSQVVDSVPDNINHAIVGVPDNNL